MAAYVASLKLDPADKLAGGVAPEENPVEVARQKEEERRKQQDAIERELRETRERQEREEAATVIARSKAATGIFSSLLRLEFIFIFFL